ncbi:GNAT family N-acetyltransferase [Methylomonas koyamae]|uniref:GNAT family N-acetyltransferase n=1 Tax=Methylomonas koyamae TaxID=702114 RepID=UPI00391DA7AA
MDIEPKLSVQPELFLVGVDADADIIGTAMAGYAGHRGWFNYLAVAPDKRRSALGRQLIHAAETELTKRSCPKTEFASSGRQRRRAGVLPKPGLPAGR